MISPDTNYNTNTHPAAESRLTIYTAPGCEQAEKQIEQHSCASHISIQFCPINKSIQQAVYPLIILCQDEQQAEKSVSQYQLTGGQIYWLPLKNAAPLLTAKLPGHWFSGWHDPALLASLLDMLVTHQQLHINHLRREQILSLLMESLGELHLILNQDGQIVEVNPALVEQINLPQDKVTGYHWLDIFNIPSISARNRMNSILAELSDTRSLTRLPPFPLKFADKIMMVDGFAGPLSESTSMETLLVLRQVASWQAQTWMKQQNTGESPVTLMLINPDNFAQCNKQYGRETGDIIMAEIRDNVSTLLRTNDFVTRYSGAVFAAHLPATDSDQARQLATQMRQHLAQQYYSNAKVRLKFSIGLATLDAKEQLGEQSPIELFRRANSALQAARSVGGDKLVCWQPEFDANVIANLDRMSGKFSSAPDDDFRLMLLQWEIIRLIGNAESLNIFSHQVCQTLFSGLQSVYTGLYLYQHGRMTLLAEQRNSDALIPTRTSLVDLLQRTLTRHSGNPDSTIALEISGYDSIVVPLVTRDECQGMLLASWGSGQTNLSRKCTSQLEQIAPNLAVALDRILLVEQQHKRLSTNPAEPEVSHPLIFESAAMRTLMQQVQLVGPTDASVLIIGDSGTGKELIAQQLHNNSLRPDKPFITVDCSTIVGHLIESELFGHRKGAFTGAIQDKPGRIAQADGGTLFLDEIGELPLDIQSKLLRFVQEKTYVAVGDQHIKKVDVRLILATNRNLPDEVAEGRFRGDLYYRINVFTLNLPPLNQRGDDALLLARHYLQHFNRHYNKNIRGLSADSVQKLVNYSWPGNVRELQNVMMRAVILCQDEYLQPEHLILQESEAGKESPLLASPPEPYSADYYERFDRLLFDLVTFCHSHTPPTPVSLWLEKQFLQQCLQHWETLYQVAQNLKMSESTLRRRYQKVQAMTFPHMPPESMLQDIHQLFEFMLTRQDTDTLWPEIEHRMIKSVLEKDLSQQQRAELLNVTQPTLRKIIQQHRLTVL